MQDFQYDIVIVGAGVVGLALACALGKTHLRIAVINPQDPQTDIQPDKFSVRVSAITLSSMRFLLELNVWQRMPVERMSYFNEMHVWEAQSGNKIDFASENIGEDHLGFIVENNVLQNALVEQLQTFENVKLIYPAELRSIQFMEEMVLVNLSDEQCLQAKLIVGADGIKSKTRECLNIQTKGWSYQQSALVCNVTMQLPHQNKARQVFLSTGPLAFLPLPDEYACSIVWSTTPIEAEILLHLPDNEFKERLASAFQFQLGAIKSISERAVFPLAMQHAINYAKESAVLIGDAAHTIHPLAGQGVNLGLHDAECLAAIIFIALGNNRSFHALYTLRKYERERKSANLLMINMIEIIKRVFTTENKTVRSLASWGFSLTDKNTWLKNFFIRRAV